MSKPNCHLISLWDHPWQTDNIPWHAGSWVVLVQFGFLCAKHWWRLWNSRPCSWVVACISSAGLGFGTELWVCSSNRASATCAEDHFIMTSHCGVLLCCFFFHWVMMKLFWGWYQVDLLNIATNDFFSYPNISMPNLNFCVAWTCLGSFSFSVG